VRHYIPHKNNPDWLPHNIYMQIFYLIRDYEEGIPSDAVSGRRTQKTAIEKVIMFLKEEYKKRPATYGEINPVRAFFEYPYFSMMFTQSGREMGAGKRRWNLYRCHFARLVAEELRLH